MSDDPYAAPKVRYGGRRKKAQSRPVSGSVLLWLVVGTMAAILTFSGFPETRFIVGLVVVVLCAVGLWLNWGPMIPSMFIGATVFALMTDPISSSHIEAVWKGIGVPIAGAIFGAIVGFIMDLRATGKHRSVKINLPE